jgi:hypothetical protein
MQKGESETDSDDNTEKPTPKKQKQEFQCMRSAPIVPKNTDNSLIFKELQRLHDRHKAEGEPWRALSYSKVS